MLEAVAEAVPEPLTVPLLEGVPLGDWLGLTLLDQEVEPVVEALAPAVKEAVGLADRVLLALSVVEPVLLLLPVGVCVALPVGVPLGLWLGETLLLSEMELLLLALAPADSEAVGEADTVELPLRVVEPVLLPDPLPV